MEYPSKLIQDAVENMSKLPGIGRKTSLRMALYILKQSEEFNNSFIDSLIKLITESKYCKQCNNISDTDLCQICSNPKRDKSTICVVEDIKDVISIENTAQFFGSYHVLSGLISPIEGIGPEKLNIENLVQRVSQNQIKEIIFALSPTIEGDTTTFYISKQLKNFDLKFSVISRGIAIGSELEYTDEITLGRSIINRTDYNK